MCEAVERAAHQPVSQKQALGPRCAEAGGGVASQFVIGFVLWNIDSLSRYGRVLWSRRGASSFCSISNCSICDSLVISWPPLAAQNKVSVEECYANVQ
jgi:hypothetical protein